MGASRATYNDVAFRWSDYDVPLWTRPNTSPLRWNRAHQDATQYLSVTPEGSWAELIRSERLRTPEELRLVSMPLWVLRIRETNLADYSTFERAQDAGFPPEALVGEDYERCEAEAERLRDNGFRGVLAPSAALPGAVNLTLFGRRLAVPWDYPEASLMVSFIPAKRLAVGRPPDELLPLVRQLGEPHSLLAHHLARSQAKAAPHRGEHR
ncbi:MAG TPA: RES family NAD+ phosphorylase [Solirubrobacteraceae bacterium]|nr:RES family NAD+ phosphorylase [Solirubrobacteraceae bacterium]